MQAEELQLLADLVAERLGSPKLAYSVDSAAAACDVPPSVIRRAILDGSLKASRPGRQWVITREALQRWLSR